MAEETTLGVPALFARSVFPELLQLTGDSGAKTIIFSNRERVAEFPFPKGASTSTRSKTSNRSLNPCSREFWKPRRRLVVL
ncbi:MAG TPA: hypothetical protein VKE29_03725 [Candidatus Udaeobacter sp.]|nr:hypothetical protein [Candidatus Udaeobacter sp.]